MTEKTKYFDLSKAVDPTKAPHVPLEAWDLGQKSGQSSKDIGDTKTLPSPVEVHGIRGTMVILMAGALYMGTVLFMVYMAKAALS